MDITKSHPWFKIIGFLLVLGLAIVASVYYGPLDQPKTPSQISDGTSAQLPKPVIISYTCAKGESFEVTYFKDKSRRGEVGLNVGNDELVVLRAVEVEGGSKYESSDKSLAVWFTSVSTATLYRNGIDTSGICRS